jgi:predicted HAD superfamily Cof-like phosphohydrolase
MEDSLLKIINEYFEQKKVRNYFVKNRNYQNAVFSRDKEKFLLRQAYNIINKKEDEENNYRHYESFIIDWLYKQYGVLIELNSDQDTDIIKIINRKRNLDNLI